MPQATGPARGQYIVNMVVHDDVGRGILLRDDLPDGCCADVGGLVYIGLVDKALARYFWEREGGMGVRHKGQANETGCGCK